MQASHLNPNPQVTWLVVTEVQSESFGLVTERRHYKDVMSQAPSLQRTSYVAMRFHRRGGIARFLCAMRVFDL